MHPPIAILATDACLVQAPDFHLPGGVVDVYELRLALPKPPSRAAATVPEHRFVAVVRIDMIDDGRCTDDAVAFAFAAQGMCAQEDQPFPPPAPRAVERTGRRIAFARVVAVLLALVTPADRPMDRWTDRHDVDLEGGDQDGDAGSDNARDRSNPSWALLS